MCWWPKTKSGWYEDFSARNLQDRPSRYQYLLAGGSKSGALKIYHQIPSYRQEISSSRYVTLVVRSTIQEGGSSFNISCLGDHEQEEMHKFFGYMTIGMSWFPAISGMTMLISFRKTSFAWKNLCSDVLRFIFWPLLVPIYM